LFVFNPGGPGVDKVELEGLSLTVTGRVVGLLHGISAVSLKAELKQGLHSRERYFGGVRSARQSMNPVEEFMPLYNTKVEMATHLDELIALTKRAIESHPVQKRADTKGSS
jgi:hypothetical protein